MRRFEMTAIVLVATAAAAGALFAADAAAPPLGGSQLYGLYAQRHAATIRFAELAAAGATDSQVIRTAGDLAQAHRKAKERLEKDAAERQIALASPSPSDASAALLKNAVEMLQRKSGPDYDAAWTGLAHNWLSSLILDNNRNVTPRVVAPELQSLAREHTTFMFRQMAAIDKLRKKSK